MKIYTNLKLTGRNIMELLEEKYPDIDCDFIWIDFRETKEHWEDVNRKKVTELTRPPELKRKVIRLFKDGSFDEAIEKDA